MVGRTEGDIDDTLIGGNVSTKGPRVKVSRAQGPLVLILS